MLSIVATPIGNLKDITLRSLETLNSVDGIICEDTRVASKLLNHYQIKKPLIILNNFNENSMVSKIIEKLLLNQNLALVSDAGTPLISDPGFKLVRECIKLNIKVDSIPGPSSVITALTLSGLPPDKFLFLGYLPEKPINRTKIYQQIEDISKIIQTTFIIFIAPFKLKKTIEELKNSFGDIQVTLAHELTKIHQSIETTKLSNLIKDLQNHQPKGELVMLLNLAHPSF